MTYTALEKLYGLKLYEGEITVDRIPTRHRANAIEYAKTLGWIEN